MVGFASPFDHADGQNRDIILESIRAWASQNLLTWSGSWQTFFTGWIANVDNYLTANAIQGPVGPAGPNSVPVDTFIASLITAATSQTKTAIMARNFFADVRDYGAKLDGVTNDAPAITAALTAGFNVFIPYTAAGCAVGNTVTIPFKQGIYGGGKYSTRLLKTFNGDMFNMADSSTIRDLSIDGQGATYTGKGITFINADGHQTIQNVNIHDTAGPCLDYAISAGSQSRVTNCDIFRYQGVSGSGLYAVTIADAVMLAAVPRHFTDLEFQGYCSFSLGGSNDTFIVGTAMGDMLFSPNTRGLNMTAVRLMNQTNLTVDGHNNTIVGCDINPIVTIAAGADAITLGPGSFNHLPVVDNSGNSRNMVTHWTIPYTPVLTAGGTAPVLGNGTLTGNYSRQGSVYHYEAELILGSTTTLGTGGLQISLPHPTYDGFVQTIGPIVMLIGVTTYMGVARNAGPSAGADLLRDTSGNITYNSPAVFGPGDTLRLAGTYTL